MRIWSTAFTALALAAWLLAAPGLASAEWMDHADPLKPAVEDDPAWDEYAFELPFISGEGRLTFHELARSGEPFVLYWWLTDCPMCHLQMPYVQQLYNESQKRELGLRVVSICIDSDKRDSLEYIEDKGIKFDVLFDGRSRRTDSQYDVRENGTPLAYVFEGGGVPAGKLSGYTSSFAQDVLELLGIEPDESSEAEPGAG
jgi:peroxiredoxin